MYKSVEDNYATFTAHFEGQVPWMYLDVKGFVTTGIGNLIDPVASALVLPWRHGANGPLASEAEIRAAWDRVKSAQDKRTIGGGKPFWQTLTDLRLDDDGIRQLVTGKLRANEAILTKRFPMFESWPADAQLAVLSMAWALGPNFRYPKFQALVNQAMPDFRAAADEAKIGEAGNPGVVPRNVVNKALLQSAANAVEQGLDFSQVNWPGWDQFLAEGKAALGRLQVAAPTIARTATKTAIVGNVVIGGGVLAALAAWYYARKS